MKEDKLFMRTKIKQLFKQLQSLDGCSPHSLQLLQIFSQCRKPLPKIHLYENHSRELQVKLRKYIANERKKHKEACLEHFKMQKINQNTERLKTMKKKVKGQKFMGKEENFFLQSGKKSSESTKNLEMVALMETKRFNQTWRNNLNSGNYSPCNNTNRNVFPQSCKSLSTDKSKPAWNSKTKLQANQTHKIIKQQSHQKKFPKEYQQKQFELNHQFSARNLKSSQKHFNLDKSLKQKNSKDKQIERQKGINHEKKQVHTDFGDKQLKPFNKESIQSGIYTSPQFLENCRQFMKASRQQIDHISFEMKQRSSQKQEVNAFQKIQLTYQSPKFVHNSRFATLKQLLKYIFAQSPKVYLTKKEIKQIIDRCPEGMETIISQLLESSNEIAICVDFVYLFSSLSTILGATFSFSNVFSLLDIDSKGFVCSNDFEAFASNFVDCSIDPDTLLQLKSRLLNFQKAVTRVFYDQEIVPGCFQYMELIESSEIFQLCEILELFEFEIDCNTGSFSQIQE